MRRIFRRILSTMIIVTLLAGTEIPVFATESDEASADVLIERQDVSITSGSVYDLTSDVASSSVLDLDQATIVITYQSTSNETYQSLFSVSNSTTGNENRHFHIYVTPTGTLGMELRNTDEEFKYTMAASGAVTNGAVNSIAFSADAENAVYKLYANGELVSTLSKEEYKFFSDITGLDTISLGGTIRGGNIRYPFGGTISDFKIYNTVLDESILKEETAQSTPEIEDFTFEKDDVTITSGSVFDLTDEEDAANMMAMKEGTIIIQYTSTGSNSYQSLFSISNSTTGNQDRHFHLYITPDGTLYFPMVC